MTEPTKQTIQDSLEEMGISKEKFFDHPSLGSTIFGKITPNPIPLENTKKIYEQMTNNYWEEAG